MASAESARSPGEVSGISDSRVRSVVAYSNRRVGGLCIPGRVTDSRGFLGSGLPGIRKAHGVVLFARLLRPSLHDDLFLRKKINRIAALGMKVTEETVLPAGERKVCHWRGDPDI